MRLSPLSLPIFALACLAPLHVNAEDWGAYAIVPVSAPAMVLEASEAGRLEAVVGIREE